MKSTVDHHVTRTTAITGALAAAAGLAPFHPAGAAGLALVHPAAAGASALSASGAAGACAEGTGAILNRALTAERIAITYYYTALTTPAILRDSRLAGLSPGLHNPARPPNGAPQHVRFLQAALDAEVKHADLLAQVGAASPYRHFYFPPTTFASLGTTLNRGSFLGVLEMLEATCVGLYIAAACEFLRSERHDLAALATEMMGVEAEHRALGRVIAGVRPPNDLTLERAPFACADESAAALRPFLTGTRFLYAVDATRATALPTRAQTARVIGKYGTRRVRRFL